jgi:hypothetical protein
MEEQEVQVEVPAEEPKETQAEPEITTEAEVVEPPKPKKTAQERIDELTRKRRDAERDAEYWRTKALEKEAPKEPAPAAPATGEPKLENFDSHEEWMKSWSRWDRKQEEVQRTQTTREQALDKAYREYERRAEKARASHDDFDDAVGSTLYTDTMKIALWKTELGPEMAYHIATHPQDAERMRSLSPDEQLIEIGRLETKLLIAKQTKKAPDAPAPIKPLGMGGGGQDKDPSKMTDDEWFAWKKQKTEEEIRRKKSGGQ